MFTPENKTKQNLIFVTYCLTRPHINHVHKSKAYQANTQQNGSAPSWQMTLMFKRSISFDTLHRVSDRKNICRSLSSAFRITILSRRHNISTYYNKFSCTEFKWFLSVLTHAFRLSSSCELCTLRVFLWLHVHVGDFILTFFFSSHCFFFH